MAYSNAPMVSVDQNKPVNLLYAWDSRDDSTHNYDTVLKNTIAEKVGKDEFRMIKREGTEVAFTPTGATSKILGIYYWELVAGTTFIVVVTVLATTSVIQVGMYSTGTFTPFGAGGSFGTGPSTSEVSFQEFLYQNGTVDLLISVIGGASGGGVYRLTSAGILSGPIVNAPANGSLAYLDGYAIGHDATAIYNSNLNDPTTWVPSNFLSVDSYPDNIAKITRMGPYIVVLGYDSIQWFYDAANPTGTPFASVVGATKRIGYLGGWATQGDVGYFIGSSQGGPPTLYKLEGLNVTPLESAPFARMYVDNNWYSNNIAFGYVRAFPPGSILSINGHLLYFVRTNSQPGQLPPSTDPVYVGESYCFDLTSNVWTKMGYQGNENMLIKQSTVFYQPTLATAQKGRTYFCLLGDTSVKRFNNTLYQDSGVNFEMKFRTSMENYGTNRIKFGTRIIVDCDQTPTTSNVMISWTDNDYQTFSTPRAVDVSHAYKQLYALGRFRKRAYQVTYSDNFPMRVQGLEFDYVQGSE